MRFQSKYPNYKIWVRPSAYLHDNLGNPVFRQGIFAQFINGWYETEDEEIIKALKAKPEYGIDYWSVDDEKVELNPAGKTLKATMEQKKEELVTDCPLCGKTFKNRAGVLGHMKIVHKDEK